MALHYVINLFLVAFILYPLLMGSLVFSGSIKWKNWLDKSEKLYQIVKDSFYSQMEMFFSCTLETQFRHYQNITSSSQ